MNIKIAHLQLEIQWAAWNKLLSSKNYLARQEFDNDTNGRTALLCQSCLNQSKLLLQQSISCHSFLVPHLRTALAIPLSHNCNLLLTVTQVNLTQVSSRAETYTPIIAYLKYEFRWSCSMWQLSVPWEFIDFSVAIVFFILQSNTITSCLLRTFHLHVLQQSVFPSSNSNFLLIYLWREAASRLVLSHLFFCRFKKWHFLLYRKQELEPLATQA